MSAFEDLFERPAGRIDFETLRQFVGVAEEANLLAESLTIELKLKRNGNNIAEAVAALANTDGGVVLVGIAEDRSGDDRLVGLSAKERDALISNLHSLVSDAMPEVIPVAVPGTDQCIVILRVDADASRHPVVVNGRVVFRIPGQTAPADRDKIQALTERDQHGNSTTWPVLPRPGFSPGYCELWGNLDRSLELRVFGSVRLPGRVLDQPWFGTHAKEQVVATLAHSALPDLLWSTSAPLNRHPWLITDARSDWMHLESEAKPDLLKPYPIVTAAHADLNGRDLLVLIALGVLPSADPPTSRARLSIQLLHEALCATLATHAALCRAVSAALDAAEPMIWAPIEALLTIGKPGEYGNVDEAVDLNRWPRDTTSRQQNYPFRRAISPQNDLNAIDNLAREWLTLMLLDVAASNFEPDIARLELPPYMTG